MNGELYIEFKARVPEYIEFCKREEEELEKCKEYRGINTLIHCKGVEKYLW